ncbi:metallophosphoesterase [Actinoplanes sp. TRM 88003]|uniref:Metallophosphoesterase n=1 Tax=Paractinoplanes aksuensis TaxID=2939490 RepID=A0ABT1E480_9ACTN|nr:metallophosphoesterase [Actinoplanes aksuensis]MCO8277678.1 metallophosphoesterase [Actinoplanes aksuensis]
MPTETHDQRDEPAEHDDSVPRRWRAALEHLATSTRQILRKKVVRRAGLSAMVVLVAFTGIYAGLLAAGPTRSDLGPFSASFSLTPSWTGDTALEIPPLGAIGLDSHDGPAHLTVRLDALDQDRTFALASDSSGLETASQTAAADVRRGLIELGLRTLVAGLLGTLVVATLAFRNWRRVLLSLGAAVVTMVATGSLAATTFRADSINEPTYQGLLVNAPSVIGDVQHIAAQFTRYRDQLQRMVGNISKVYATLSTLPAYQATPGTTRVLHVSDLHLNPAAWAVIDAVVRQYDIDVVIDTGDINDWGSSIESSFVDPIGSLDAPYVYVRGNHDSELTAAAVAAEPNAVVLDNRTATVAGLTIAGIGDPRFTPDKQGDNDSAGMLEASGSELAATIGAAGVPVDIALVHDPASAGPLNGTVPLVLAGHRHTREVSIMDPIPERPRTRLMVGGSAGGAGLRGLEGEAPTPLEMSILYLGQSRVLQAYDEITIGGTGQAEVTVKRHIADDDLPPPSSPLPTAPASPPAEPAVSAPVSASPS